MKYVYAILSAIALFAVIMLFFEFSMYMESLMTVKTPFYFLFHRIVAFIIAFTASFYCLASMIWK